MVTKFLQGLSKAAPAALFGAIVAACGVCSALAAEFPAKPVRLVVPFSADGGAGMQAQVLARALRRNLGQQVLVQHHPGAGGVIGSEAVVSSPADGHTLLFTSAGFAVNAAWLGAQLPFSALTDFVAVSLVSSAPLVLAVHPAVPAQTVPQLVALARRAQPVLRAGGNAPGGLSHVAITLFSRAAGFRAELALFNGGGPAARALIGGELDALFIAAPVALPHLAVQRLRPLAITTAGPHPLFAGAPELSRFYPGLVLENWYALLAPAQTPQAVITRFNAETARALDDQEVREFLLSRGIAAVGGSPEALTVALKREIDRRSVQIRSGELRLQ